MAFAKGDRVPVLRILENKTEDRRKLTARSRNPTNLKTMGGKGPSIAVKVACKLPGCPAEIWGQKLVPRPHCPKIKPPAIHFMTRIEHGSESFHFDASRTVWLRRIPKPPMHSAVISMQKPMRLYHVLYHESPSAWAIITVGKHGLVRGVIASWRPRNRTIASKTRSLF